MIGALIRKELRQHWWAFLLIALLSLLAIGWILLFSVMQEQGGSHLFSLRLHAFFLAVSALILGSRLVVAEYSASTQIFLESLPLPRRKIVLVKYFLGLTVMLLCAASALGIAMAASARTEVYTPRFVGILTSRYLCYSIFVYTFFFTMGFLGRFRFAAYALIVLGVTLVVKTRDVQLHELAPIYLVGGMLPFERQEYPTTALAITGGLTVALFLLAFILAITREGSISSLLGERMSYRDKITLTALIFGILAAVFVIDERKVKAPYEMNEGVQAKNTELAAVTVAPKSSHARELANKLGKDIDQMAEFLGLAAVPPVFLIERPDLDPDQFEHGFLDTAEGIILRTSYQDDAWRYERCLEQLSGDILESTSNGRVMKEDRFWVIDGFSLYWPHRADPERPLDADRHLLLRALYGRKQLGGLHKPNDLLPWFLYQEKVGHQITAGIGWSLLRVLEQKAGPEAAQAFMKSVLGADTPKNAGTTFRDLRQPIETRFTQHTGLSLAEFLDDWNRELNHWQEELKETVEAIPRFQGTLTFDSEAGATAQARYHFDPPADVDSAFFKNPVLLYGETAPFRNQVGEIFLKRQPLSDSEEREGWLRDTWGKGSGLAWTFAAESPELRCRLISGWRHEYVP